MSKVDGVSNLVRLTSIVQKVNIVMKIIDFVMTFVKLIMTVPLVTYAMRTVNA